MPNFIEMNRWGKDHWGTLAYAETCSVEGQHLHLERMRCDPTRHPLLASSRITYGATKYPTYLKDEVLQSNHDDWDCLYDAACEGLITLHGFPEDFVINIVPGKRGQIFPNVKRKKNSLGYEWGGKPVVKFTELGFKVIAELRKHKANGGSFGTFEYQKI
ncbi:hypothetical protein HYS94_01630 [Candidatus Daviesbacteria bacterium]|nr:hypothetical protein [Candidatus Daviesbacteria bacterium]